MRKLTTALLVAGTLVVAGAAPAHPAPVPDDPRGTAGCWLVATTYTGGVPKAPASTTFASVTQSTSAHGRQLARKAMKDDTKARPLRKLGDWCKDEFGKDPTVGSAISAAFFRPAPKSARPTTVPPTTFGPAAPSK